MKLRKGMLEDAAFVVGLLVVTCALFMVTPWLAIAFGGLLLMRMGGA